MANENLKTYDWDDSVALTEDQERGGHGGGHHPLLL